MGPRYALLSVALWLVASPTMADLGGLPCEPSDELSEAAAALVLSRVRPTAESLLPAAREAGYDGVSLHASFAEDDGALVAWLNGLRHREDARMLCGEAVGSGKRLVLVAPLGGELSVVDGRIFGQLGPDFSNPHLVVQGADGQPHRMPVGVASLSAGVPVPPDLVPPLEIQLVAEGPGGPRPVAELTLNEAFGNGPLNPFVGGAPPARSPLPPAARRAADAGSLSGGLRSRIDAFRSTLHAPSLRANRSLDSSAQQHASRVCELGQVAHRIGATDDPVTRLRAERIEARAVGEAIARSSDADAALDAIFDSPSHRYAVTERRFTDVGIGHARDTRGRSCLVVLLAAWPRRIP